MLRVVRSEAHEERHISVLQSREVAKQGFGVGEELETAIAAQIVLYTAVDGATFSYREVFEAEGEGLLILLEALTPLGIDGAGYPRRKGVAHGRAVCVLLDIDRCDGEVRALAG